MKEQESQLSGDFGLRTSDSGLPTKRYVSLYGFFSFDYPVHWKNEVDEAGNYVFFDDQGGSGVLRMIMIQNELKDEQAAGKYLDELSVKQKEFDATDLIVGNTRFIRFVQIHDIEQTEYTVYYWATAFADKILWITYTVQSAMKYLLVAEKEKKETEGLLISITFMQEDKDHHH